MPSKVRLTNSDQRGRALAALLWFTINYRVSSQKTMV